MTPDRTLIPLASELIGVVRDYSPADVAAVLARVPDDKRDALVVLLAAMVDPDARPSQLLAWTRLGPVPSRPFVPAGYSLRSLPPETLGRRSERRMEVGRLSNLGLTVDQIAERLGITSRAVTRHRSAIRAGLEEVS
jgi:hypothetical protein